MFLYYSWILTQIIIFLMLTVFIVVCLLLNLGILNFNVFLLHFRIALTMQSPWAISCLPSVFIHMILLNFSHVYYFQWLLFYIDSVHSCERNLITHKAKHIYCLNLYRVCWLLLWPILNSLHKKQVIMKWEEYNIFTFISE